MTVLNGLPLAEEPKSAAPRHATSLIQQPATAVWLAIPPPGRGSINWLRANSFSSALGARPWLLHVAGWTFGLRPGATYVLGRAADADIAVDKGWPKGDTARWPGSHAMRRNESIRSKSLPGRGASSRWRRVTLWRREGRRARGAERGARDEG